MNEIITPNTVAPPSPTTNQLHRMHPLPAHGRQAIDLKRQRIAASFNDAAMQTLFMPGYCTLPERSQLQTVMQEGQQVAQLEYQHSGLTTVHRGPIWKPRTNPADWHGQETTDPIGAHESLTKQAEYFGHVAIEVGFAYHLPRYAGKAALVWLGGRNDTNDTLLEDIVMYDPSLPVAIKNGLDGDVDKALIRVEYARSLRSEGDAPVFLLYRGGENARNPEDWIAQYLYALSATEGRMMVDTAHGTEMAFDPDGKFKKSIEGQIKAWQVILMLAEHGHRPWAVTSEASRLKSDMDPHMPLQLVLSYATELHTMKPESVLAA